MHVEVGVYICRLERCAACSPGLLSSPARPHAPRSAGAAALAALERAWPCLPKMASIDKNH
eukprot:6214749-Pleurochrysis_carterae.AAC.1